MKDNVMVKKNRNSGEIKFKIEKSCAFVINRYDNIDSKCIIRTLKTRYRYRPSVERAVNHLRRTAR